MKKSRFPRLFLVCILALGSQVGRAWPAWGGAAAPASVEQARAPRLFPDYTGIVIPPNIAPLNFRVEEPGARYRVELRSTRGKSIIIAGRSATICIPPKPWRALLCANAGEPLFCDVWVQSSQGPWERLVTVTNFIARESIDQCLVYRRLKPLYTLYNNLGIYQRQLESFDERPVLDNSGIHHQCVNCHTFLNRQPHTFALQVRASEAPRKSMLLVRSNTVARVDQPMGYLSWHPSGRLIAFSTDDLGLCFHTSCTNETREVYNASSHLGIYWVDSNRVVMPPEIGMPGRNQTWPAWSPDGRYLYYCSAPAMSYREMLNIRYDLMRISYDIDKNQWGEPQIGISAEEADGSICQPKPSPDGRYVLFCLCPYGSFPVYHSSSALCVLDLATHQCRRLNIKSDQADSWHCWSSNSRWIVFSSKRLDGLFARPFFSHVDEECRFSKPFLLPQEDPAFYDSCLQTFNVPELVQGSVSVDEGELAQAILKPRKGSAPAAQAPQQGQYAP
jgi:hypothetical protein